MTQLSDVFIIHLHIFKYIDEASKNFIPSMSIDKEISRWGNRIVIFGVIYLKALQSSCGRYTLVVNVNNTTFLTSDTKALSQQKLQCRSWNISVP